MYHAQTWENVLLSLAGEADSVDKPVDQPPTVSPDLLMFAHEQCEQITAVHSKSFHLASGLLPEKKKRAVRALYAFCRVTDDIVDCPTGDVKADLAEWQAAALSANPPLDNKVALAWADARLQYNIPLRFAEQLIEGVARDMHQDRYETFADLATYAYGVAATVGLMSMHIIGFESEAALPYAIKLGLALQMTNILRDVGEDWQRGRLYLPQQELSAFGLTEADIDEGIVTERWRSFMQFQIARNRKLYEESWPGIGMLNADGRFAIAAAAGIYRAILDDIEANDYDVFNRRAYVSTWGKLSMLPQLWWRSRRPTRPAQTTTHQPATA